MRNKEYSYFFNTVTNQLVSTGFKPSSVEKAVSTNDLYLLQNKYTFEDVYCSKCDNDSEHLIKGTGDRNSPVMIVGEAPGYQELSMGIPFVGPAGTALVMMLDALNVYRGNVFMTNAMQCAHYDSKTNKIATPSHDDIDKTRARLLMDIYIQQPSIIIGLGASALYALTMKTDKISQIRGTIQNISKETLGIETKMIFTWHPSYLIRQTGEKLAKVKQEMWDDLNSAFAFAKEQNPGFNFNKRPQL